MKINAHAKTPSLQRICDTKGTTFYSFVCYSLISKTVHFIVFKLIYTPVRMYNVFLYTVLHIDIYLHCMSTSCFFLLFISSLFLLPPHNRSSETQFREKF